MKNINFGNTGLHPVLIDFALSGLQIRSLLIFQPRNLSYLLTECMAIDKTGFEEITLNNLADYAVTVRYPDDFLIPSVRDAMDHKKIALLVKEIVESKINIP